MSLTPNLPPGPTGKPLTDLRRAIPLGPESTPGGGSDVFRILGPGHYFLTHDLAVPSGATGILVNAFGVVLDLNGFTIRGAGGNGWGIRWASTVLPGTLTIRNGRLRNLESGLYIAQTPYGLHAKYLVRTERLIVAGCTGDGITVLGADLVARYCISDNNGESGFSAPFSNLEFCRACGNGVDGFSIGSKDKRSYATRGCVASNNGRDGFNAAGAIMGHHLVDCAANNNGRFGFVIAGGGRVERCLASGNEEAGIQSGSSPLVRHNLSRQQQSGAGFVSGAFVALEGNHSVSNQTGYSRTSTLNAHIRNTASGNTVNWSFTGASIYPITEAVKAPASSDAPYGAPLGSANARTNYSV